MESHVSIAFAVCVAKVFPASSVSVLLRQGEEDVIDLVEKKVARLTGWHGSSTRIHRTQLLAYTAEGRYRLHTDCHDFTIHTTTNETKLPSERSHTLLVYLTNVKEGGETIFPHLSGGMRIPPRRGNAILFSNLDRNGRCHPDSAHEAAPVRGQGMKLILQRWYCTPTDHRRHPTAAAANCGEDDEDNAGTSSPGGIHSQVLCDGVDCRLYISN